MVSRSRTGQLMCQSLGFFHMKRRHSSRCLWGLWRRCKGWCERKMPDLQHSICLSVSLDIYMPLSLSVPLSLYFSVCLPQPLPCVCVLSFYPWRHVMAMTEDAHQTSSLFIELGGGKGWVWEVGRLGRLGPTILTNSDESIRYSTVYTFSEIYSHINVIFQNPPPKRTNQITAFQKPCCYWHFKIESWLLEYAAEYEQFASSYPLAFFKE